jgi:hypothetical protein
MDWFLRTLLHNLAIQAGGSAALVLVTIGLLQLRSAITWKMVIAVAGISAIVLTACLTALKWRFRMEYPGNYPLFVHFILATIPVVVGTVTAGVAMLIFLRFRAVPPN